MEQNRKLKQELRLWAGLEMRPWVGLVTRPFAGSEMTPWAGLEMGPWVGLEMKPGAGLEMKLWMGLELRPGAGLKINYGGWLRSVWVHFFDSPSNLNWLSTICLLHFQKSFCKRVCPSGSRGEGTRGKLPKEMIFLWLLPISDPRSSNLVSNQFASSSVCFLHSNHMFFYTATTKLAIFHTNSL